MVEEVSTCMNEIMDKCSEDQLNQADVKVWETVAIIKSVRRDDARKLIKLCL